MSLIPKNGVPVIVSRDGPWSLFRVLELGDLQVRGQFAIAEYFMDVQNLQYQIAPNSLLNNPLELEVLREFKCPTEF